MMIKSASVVFVISFLFLLSDPGCWGEPVMSKSTLGGTSDSFDLFQYQEKTKWKVFTHTNPDFAYRVEYPPDWSVEKNENVCLFIPPHAKPNKDSIAIVVINYDKTPPLPIQHTYTTVRTVTVDAEEILVRKRQPSPATEKYFAERKKGGYVAEFRFSLDGENDAVFDHMLSTFTFTSTK
jgi:hypothetical protein